MITNVQIANIISDNLSTPVNKDEVDKIANIICDMIEKDEKIDYLIYEIDNL